MISISLFIFLTVITTSSCFAAPLSCARELSSSSVITNELAGKNILITGATFGIGKFTALGLARKGASVTIVGRDLKRTQEAVDWIRQNSENPDVDFMLADLSELKQVKKLAEDFKASHDHLDVLVNNAGALFTQPELTTEGLEKTWALNHLSPMLLTLALEDVLKKSGHSRVVNVASALYEKGDVNRALSPDSAEFKGMKVYGDSKLASVLTTFFMAQKFRSEGITVNCLHPGFVDTGIGANNKGFFGVMMKLTAPFKKVLKAVNYMITPEQGAETSIYLASAADVSDVTGQYFFKKAPVETKSSTQDLVVQNKVWTESIKQIERVIGAGPK